MVALPPPLITLAAGLGQRLLAPERRPGRLRTLAAGALAVGSVSVMAWAVREFSRADTSLDPMDPERATTLVTSGPYRFTRNPMYVTGAGLLAAHALWRGGAVVWLPVLADVALVDRLQITREEPVLAARFGDGYLSYRRRVPRWIGPPRSS